MAVAAKGPASGVRDQPGIAAVGIRGYKSIYQHQEIEIRPLTVLAGVNSAGKSSILQPLLLMKQTLEAPFDPGPLLLDGPHVSITSLGPSEFASRAIARIIHLPAHRGDPARTYATVAVADRYPGPFPVYTAGVVAAWQNRGETAKLEQLRADLAELRLTADIEARRLDDARVELLVGRLPGTSTGDLVNIADVGFGVSQTLPVVVALLAARPGQLVYLEQPEIHLHPRAQVAFVALLRRAAERGVRVIVETHSSLLLRGSQTAVAEGALPTDDVVLHWFTRDETTGHTKVTTGTLDETGGFGDWPEDFDEINLEAEARYLDAAARRGAAT